MQNLDEVKENIKSQIDIVDLIGDYVTLRKRGKNYLGLCPFHNEKSPSFNVSQDGQFYKCFGCGKYGDSFTFLMEYNSISFMDSFKLLAAKCGIELEEIEKKKDDSKSNLREQVIECMNEAAIYFQTEMINPQNRNSLDYFRNRDFSNETIAKFVLGYSPSSRNGLYQHLRDKGFDNNTIFEAGLTVKKEGSDQEYFDRFKNRAMFPIKDIIGRIIGFGGRILNEDKEQSKYINSPKTILYDKSKVLYGLFESKNSIRNLDEAIMVEGYADVITMHQAGFENVVASSGTSLTQEQLSQLLRLTKNLIFIYDSDSAGQKATSRGLPMALEKGFNVYVVSLPQGDDPDSIIRTKGKNTFKQLLTNNKKEFIEFLAEGYSIDSQYQTVAGKGKALREIVELIKKIPDSLQHDFFIAKTGKIFDLSSDQIKRIYKEIIQSNNHPIRNERSEKREKSDDETPDTSDERVKINELILEKSILPEELQILKIFIDNKKEMNEVYFNAIKNNFISELGQEILEIIYEKGKITKRIVESILVDEKIEEYKKNFIVEISLNDLQPLPTWKEYRGEMPGTDIEKILLECINSLKVKTIDSKVNILKGQFINSEKSQHEIIARQIMELSDLKDDIVSGIKKEK